jgi:hypothetical protein
MVNNYYPVINEYKATLEQIESNLSENKTIEVETLPQDTLE